MIDLDKIDSEIHDLEARGDTTYSLCERLAWLYIVRDHIMPPQGKEETITRFVNGSEFLNVCSGVNYNDLMMILNNHMEKIAAVFPNEYDAVIEKIRALHLN